MKTKVTFQCSNCGAIYPRWIGRCNYCGEWNTIAETVPFKEKTQKSSEKTTKFSPQKLTDIKINLYTRIPSGINEFDRVLGGGFLPGSVILIAGEPGIGKSTLVLQILESIQKPSLYITGEESYEQIKIRANRLNIHSDELQILCETNIETISSLIENFPATFFVVDSIQTLYTDELPSAPGSLQQVKETVTKLVHIVKQTNKIVLLIGHINKEGNIAGPKALEHIVDCVLSLEGERTSNLRVVRPLKNRFGSTFEIGLFEMSEFGLQELVEPSKILVSHTSLNNPGVAFSAFIEGNRSLAAEIQSLVSYSSYSIPQRNINGYDFKRLQMILAVLDKKINLKLRQSDVFVNITGGIFISDTGIDLAIASSLFSSLNDVVIPSDIAIIGEIGLTGEVRNILSIDKRIIELEKLGFRRIVVPKSSKRNLIQKTKSKIIQVEKVSEAFNYIFG
ncbi:MAG: DNA repair protein RadA [Ignavibacteria bacterium]|nr:DNA repair protein RadA [Ignavibacteria bacterium]